jgi:hypothetical protein
MRIEQQLEGKPKKGQSKWVSSTRTTLIHLAGGVVGTLVLNGAAYFPTNALAIEMGASALLLGMVYITISVVVNLGAVLRLLWRQPWIGVGAALGLFIGVLMIFA